jgi:branched-chain amino acid transport system permease protein
LSLIALKAAPVLILGGFTGARLMWAGSSSAWAAGRSVLGAARGRAIENWFAYVMALGFPSAPQGLFGERS